MKEAISLARLLYELTVFVQVPGELGLTIQATCSSQLGKLLIDSKLAQQALPYLKEAVGIFKSIQFSESMPSNLVSAFGNLAVAYRQLGEIEKGLAICDEAIPLASGNPIECTLLYLKANLLKDKSNLIEALSAYQQSSLGLTLFLPAYLGALP